MIIDSSALLAIYFNEPEKEEFLDLILNTESAMISAANYVEVHLRVDHALNETARLAFDEFFSKLKIEIMPVRVEQSKVARIANQAYGRASGHKAKLNYGDCFAYALAKELDKQLLFKGEDFIHTDVQQAR